jgi:hypothetical protein
MIPKNDRIIMIATVEILALFGADICWRNRKQRAEQIYKMINRKITAITGYIKTTPIGPRIMEGRLTPANVLLNDH